MEPQSTPCWHGGFLETIEALFGAKKALPGAFVEPKRVIKEP
jgi:hypothetical protein